MLNSDSTDTLAQKIAPPEDESDDARHARILEENLAYEVSKRIDAEIRACKMALRKRKAVKVLVLGQAESGEFRLSKRYFRSLSDSYYRQARPRPSRVCITFNHDHDFVMMMYIQISRCNTPVSLGWRNASPGGQSYTLTLYAQ